MNFTLARAARWTAVAAGVVAYPLLAHYSTSAHAVAATPWLGVAVSLAPALAILLWLTWQSPRPLKLVLLCAGVAMGLWAFWPLLQRNFAWVYFIQHAGTNLMLAAVFGVTLAQGRQALCSRFAEAVHGSLEPDVLRYTRQLTLAWTLFFIAISLISTGLFLLAPIAVWSVFANFVSFPLVMLMFGVEYRVRLRCLPNLEKHSILDGVRAFWKPADTAAGRAGPLHQDPA